MPILYTVKAGDNLSKIARQHNISVEELKKINAMMGIEDPVIYPGDVLKIRDEQASTSHAEKVLTQNGNNTKSGIGSCPARQKISLFPVRYALDESPTSSNTNQGPNPIPSEWQSQNSFPQLNTRSYTLRQLRDGWLYVWEAIQQQLYEYKIQGNQFTLLAKTDQQGQAQQPTAEEAATKKYLEFDSHSCLYLAYSVVQCTQRVKQQLIQHHSKWMREVNLSNFYLGQMQPNTHIIKELGLYVADIIANPLQHTSASLSAPDPDFTSTTLPSVNASSTLIPINAQRKPIIQETTIQAAVPNTEDSLFVALDDPLAIVDDLTMNLIGRFAEQAAFQEQNQHKITIADNCLNLLGTDDLTSRMPTSIKQDSIKAYQCMADVNRYYTEYDLQYRIEVAAQDNSEAQLLRALSEIPKLTAEFEQKWQYIPDTTEGYNQWCNTQKTKLRNDLKYQEMLDFLAVSAATLQRYQHHITKSNSDLLVWLDQFNENITDIFYDNLNPEQSTALLEKVDTIYAYIAMTEQGKQWIGNQCNSPQTVMALATANFDKNFHQCVSTIAQQIDDNINNNQRAKPDYVNDQWLIDNIANNDNLGTLRYINTSTTTNVVSRLDEVKSAIDRIRENKAFISLADESKQALEVQRTLSATPEVNSTLQHLEYTTSAAIANQPNTILTQSILTSARIDQVAGNTINIGENLDHAWQKKEITRLRHNLTNQISYRVVRMRNADAGRITLKEGMYQRYQQELIVLKARRAGLNINKAPAIFMEMRSPIVTPNDIKLHAQIYETITELPNHAEFTAMPKSTQPITVHTKPIASRNFQQKVNEWVNGKGGYLPIAVMGFNLYNLKKVNDQAASNNYDDNAKRELISAAGYTVSAFTALYVIPYWNKYAREVAILTKGSEAQRITSTGINKWVRAGNVEVSAIASRMALGMATLSAFAAVGAGMELYQVYNNDYARATSSEEKGLLFAKMFTLGTMAGIAGAQFFGAALAPLYAFGWIMITPLVITIAVVGVLYLIFSSWAAHYKREGLRLWFYRCAWGRATEKPWQNTDSDHYRELHALYKILLQPTIKVQRSNTYRDRTGVYPLGMWVAIQLPQDLAGHTLTIDSLLVNAENSPPRLLATANLDYGQWINNGNWVALPAQGTELQLPKTLSQGPTQDTQYTSQDNGCIWLTKLDYDDSIQTAIQSNKEINIELKITYPDAIFGEAKPDQNNSYIFSLALHSTSNATAKLQTDYFSTVPAANSIINNHPDKKRLRQLPVVIIEPIEDIPQGNSND